jgi:hypothetical protein
LFDPIGPAAYTALLNAAHPAIKATDQDHRSSSAERRVPSPLSRYSP